MKKYSDNLPCAVFLDSGGGWLGSPGKSGFIAFNKPVFSLMAIAGEDAPQIVHISDEGARRIDGSPIEVLSGYLNRGLYAAGYMGYALGHYSDSRFNTTKDPLEDNFPLYYFHFFEPYQLQTGTVEELTAMFPSKPVLNPGGAQPTSNIGRDDFMAMVVKAKDYISRGDVYQVNLSRTYRVETNTEPLACYLSLFATQPVPYASFLRFSEFSLLSGSMELFLRRDGQGLLTRPIKGTRPRGRNSAEDKMLADELRQSGKERAENIMIVDLMRNDLSKVCEPGSVRVDSIYRVETYATLHQMVSEVEGKLRDNVDVKDIVESVFPPGSVTGAPKIRALEIIDELEPHHRGPYCGSIGFFEPNGDFTLSVAIRIASMSEGTLRFWVGGGIVWDSDPLEEYEETLIKAKALNRAMSFDCRQNDQNNNE